MTFRNLTIFALSASFFGMIAMAQQMNMMGGAAGGFMQGNGQAGPQTQFQGQFGGQFVQQNMGPYQPTMNPGMQQMAPQYVGEQQAYQTVNSNNCIVGRNDATVITPQVMQNGMQGQQGHQGF